MLDTNHESIKFRKSLEKLCAFSLVVTVSLSSVSCGNAWITTADREETIAAQMSKAEYAYDKSKFEEAARLFQKVLEKDPSYDDARVRLAYAINGAAGLSILDFVTKFITADTTSSQPNGQGTSKLAIESTKSNPLDILTSTVGLSPEEVIEIANIKPTTIAQIREASGRFQKLQQSWTTICKMLPEKLFKIVFETESAALKEVFEIEKCGNGRSDNAPVNSAALFAAALQFMSQAAGLFQASLDADGNNEIDIAETGIKSLAALESLQKTSKEIASGTDFSPKQYSDNLAAISEQLSVIRSLKEKINSQIVNYTLACFTFVTALVAVIPNIPSNIAKRIEKAATKINEGRSKLVQYSSFDASSSNSEQGTKVKQAAQKAAATIDSLYEKVNNLPDGKEKDERRAALDSQKNAVCSNFTATKKEFNLPADLGAPSQCASVTALTSELSQSDAQAYNNRNDFNNLETKPTSYPLFSRIPLPSELNPSLNSQSDPTDPLTDSQGAQNYSVSDDQEAFMDFAMLGEELRRR